MLRFEIILSAPHLQFYHWRDGRWNKCIKLNDDSFLSPSREMAEIEFQKAVKAVGRKVAKDEPVSVRFCEIRPLGDGRNYCATKIKEMAFIVRESTLYARQLGWCLKALSIIRLLGKNKKQQKAAKEKEDDGQES